MTTTSTDSIVQDNDQFKQKTLILFYPEKPRKFMVVLSVLLFFSTLFCLSKFYCLPDSAFPYMEPGWYKTETRDPVFNITEDTDYDYYEGRSSAPLFRGLLPMLLIVYFAFILGSANVASSGRDFFFVLCLGCACVTSYGLAWLIPTNTTMLYVIRIAMFVFSAIAFLLGLACLGIFRYKKYSFNEPLLPVLLNQQLSKERPQMSQKNKHKTKRDLVGFASLAERHWREFRPKLYHYLRKKGVLYDQLFEAGRQADEYMQKEQERPGFNLAMDYHAAREVALRTWIYLPDVDDETDEPEILIPD